MAPKPKRPLQIWIAQLLILVYSVLFPFPFVFWVLVQFNENAMQDWDEGNPYSAILLPSAIGVFLGFIGIARRKNWGRWVSIIALVLAMISFLVLPFIDPQIKDPPFVSVDNLIDDLLLYAFIWSPLALVILLLTLGRKVNAFFRPPDSGVAEGVLTDPPPPPVF